LHQSTNKEDWDEDELLGITQITKRILRNHSIVMLAQVPGFLLFLQELGNLSLRVISFCSADEDDPFIEAQEDFLDIWSTLILDVEVLQMERMASKQPVTEFSLPDFLAFCQQLTVAIFKEYTVYVLRFAEAHAMDDEEDEHGFKDYDLFLDPLTNAAVLARVNPLANLNLLSELLSQRIQLLDQIFKSQTAGERHIFLKRIFSLLCHFAKINDWRFCMNNCIGYSL
jgi:hypothetical protein